MDAPRTSRATGPSTATPVRVAAAFVVAAAAAALAQPPSSIAANAAVHAWSLRHLGWWALPVAIGAALIAAGRLLPRPRDDAAPARPELEPFGVGALFIAEPFVHLAALALAAILPHARALDAVLPATPTASALPPLALRVALLAVLAPASEEFFFRGRLLPWLRDRWGARGAVVVSAVAFAAAHGAIDQTLVALPLGVLLGWLRVAGGGLAACVLVHGAHNGLMLVAGAAAARPPAASALLVAGVALIGFAAACRAGAPRGRIAARTVVAAALVVLVSLPLGVAHARLVAVATPRVVASADLGDAQVARRLEQCRARGTAPILAVGAVLAQRWPSRGRELCVLACCCPRDAASAAIGDDDAAFDALTELQRAALPCAPADDLARAIALRHPAAFARVALVWPEALARWLPLPPDGDAAADQLAATSAPRDRRTLLDAWERAFPGRVIDLLRTVPAERIGPVERRHLRLRYDDDPVAVALVAAAERCAAAVADPPRASGSTATDGDGAALDAAPPPSAAP